MAVSPDSGEELDLAKLNALARSVLEATAVFMGADRGKWRLEFEFVDGQMQRAFRHEGPVGAGQLGGAAA
jgi:hypothetical protein